MYLEVYSSRSDPAVGSRTICPGTTLVSGLIRRVSAEKANKQQVYSGITRNLQPRKNDGDPVPRHQQILPSHMNDYPRQYSLRYGILLSFRAVVYPHQQQLLPAIPSQMLALPFRNPSATHQATTIFAMAPRRSEATCSQTRKKTNTIVTKKYKAWKEIDLMRAVVAVREGQLTKKAARRVYGVPERTLTRYLDGRMITAVAGRVSAVSDQEEDGIVEGLLDRTRLGFPATRWHLRATILDVISDGRAHQFGKAGPSDRWIASFLKRHASRISVRKGRILDTTRVNAVKKTEIEYFAETKPQSTYSRYVAV